MQRRAWLTTALAGMVLLVPGCIDEGGTGPRGEPVTPGSPGVRASRSTSAPVQATEAVLEKLNASGGGRMALGSARIGTVPRREAPPGNADAAIVEGRVSFDDEFALSNVRGQRLGFGAWTKMDPSGKLIGCPEANSQTCWDYREQWGSSDYLKVWPNDPRHFHLVFQNPNIGPVGTWAGLGIGACWVRPPDESENGAGFGFTVEGQCLVDPFLRLTQGQLDILLQLGRVPDWKKEPRVAMVGTWLEVTLQDRTTSQLKVFDMPTICVAGDLPIQLWYRARDGSVWGWPGLSPGCGEMPAWEWFVDIRGAFAVWIGRSEDARGGDHFTIEDFSIAGPSLNQPPIAGAGGPYSGKEGRTIQFSSAGSSDPDGDVLSYLWDFGDGTTSMEATPSKAYADNGTYPVTLTVTDPANATSSATTMAAVTNAAPVVQFAATSPTAFRAGGTLSVRVSFTDAGANDTPWMYTIIWGDGTANSTGTRLIQGTAFTAGHRYASAGTRSASMTVKDKDGGISVPAKITVTVTP